MILAAVAMMALSATADAEPISIESRSEREIAEKLIPEVWSADGQFSEQVWASLKDFEKQAITRYLAVDRTRVVEASVPAAPAGLLGGCNLPNFNERVFTVVGENIFGVDLWKYNFRIRWYCDDQYVWSGSYQQAWGTTHVPVWQWVGNLNSWDGYIGGQGPVSYLTYQAWTQGHFKACYQVCQHVYPWIDGRGHWDGSSGAIIG